MTPQGTLQDISLSQAIAYAISSYFIYVSLIIHCLEALLTS